MVGDQDPQIPDAPTTWPLSLRPNADPIASPGNGGSACMSPSCGPQTTASKSSNCGAIQLGSCVLVSAKQAICPRRLTTVAHELFPPNVGSAVIVPSCQRKPRHKYVV